MRKGAAFHFIPELVGDFAHVMALSGNPYLLCVETAIETLHMGSNIFSAIAEHANTKQKEKTYETIKSKYNDIEKERIKHFEIERMQSLDIQYESVKAKIIDRNVRDESVRGFISILQKELSKTIDLLENMNCENDQEELKNAHEVLRRAVRDYSKLVSLYIDGNNE